MKSVRIASTILSVLGLTMAAEASSVTLGDPQAGGIGYRYTVTMGGLDSATFSNHVGAWSWEDNSLFNAGAGEAPVGWTHTSNWVALNVSVASVFTVRIERDATVPWPSAGDPARLASTASMFPSFTIWKNWDNDLAPQSFADANNEGVPTNDFHSYNNRGAVAWAEDLIYQDHFDNSTLGVIERSYVLPAGTYTLVIGSNAPATDANRQGYKATFTTSQNLPVIVANDSYFASSAMTPLNVPVEKGILTNDSGVSSPRDVIKITAQPTKGTVQVNADGSFTYSPGQYFGVAGSDSFSYRLLIGNDPATPTAEANAVISTFAAAAGVHAGLIKDDDTDDIAGMIKLNLNSTGVWTSAVQYLGKKYPFSGSLSFDGQLLAEATKANFPFAITLKLQVDADGKRHVQADIDGEGEDQFSATVRRSPFSAVNPPPAAGKHRVTSTLASSSEGAPTGTVGGQLKVKKDGSVTFTGKLGDKTPFTCSTAIVEGEGLSPEIPIYSSVYRFPGSLSGVLNFGETADSNAAGTLTVIRPEQGAAKPAFSATYSAATTPR